MSEQKKLSNFTGQISNEVYKTTANVLDLEQKYFDILWNLFTCDNFCSDLRDIEKEIQKQYNFLQIKWNLKNKLKIPAERLTRYYVYGKLSNLIKSIYPSPVSGDIAFITEDAVINVDIKTLDKIGNANDIRNLQFLPNQSSFENRNLDSDPDVPNSGVRVEHSLPRDYSLLSSGQELPVLTYFLTIVYVDTGNNFKLCCGDPAFNTVSLTCLPNGHTSFLFDFDIISNFKTYNYLDASKGFRRIFLTDNSFDLDDCVKRFAREHADEGYILINGRTKLGVFNLFQVHPRYDARGVSWFPVRRKEDDSITGFNYYLEAVDCGDTNRIKKQNLINRYNSNGEQWEGIKEFDLASQ